MLPVTRLADAVRAAVASAFGAEHAGVDPAVHRSTFADYQADVALRLAKPLRRPPLEVARALVAELRLEEICESVSVAPPGFVNFALRRDYLEAALVGVAADPRLGVPRAENPETVVVDYSSPNVAKEMHVGNLRSSIIGDALVRLLAFQGQRVIRQNHIGDWGTPFGMLLEQLVELGAGESALEQAFADPNAFYQAARVKFDADPAFADRARGRVVLLQSGDAGTLALWQSLVEASRRYFRDVYARLGVLLADADIRGESFYNDRLAGVASALEASGVARLDAGALCVFLPEFKGREGEPLPLIVKKQDGGYGYAATDLAALRFRIQELGATRLLYVVGATQQQHFAMVFATAKRAGWLAPPVRAEHVAFGSVLDGQRKLLRTRAGDSVRLAELIDEAVERAGQAVRDKNPDLPEEVRREVARKVGVGAVKYADLSSERIKDYVFDWSRMLAFEGNTGPYLQYAHARIRSILRRGEGEGLPLAAELAAGHWPDGARIALGEAPERALALELLDFPGALEAVSVALQPHRLCVYLYELATRFTAFYEACPVLKAASPEERASRLVLCATTARTLSIGLGLLGIETPERM